MNAGPNFRKANREQLVNIAFIDAGAPLEYKIAAAEELKRRNRNRRWGIVQHKDITVNRI